MLIAPSVGYWLARRRAPPTDGLMDLKSESFVPFDPTYPTCRTALELNWCWTLRLKFCTYGVRKSGLTPKAPTLVGVTLVGKISSPCTMLIALRVCVNTGSGP